MRKQVKTKPLFRRAVLGLVFLYQHTLSPDHGWGRFIFPRAGCRYYPSCSDYFRQAVEYYGVKKALVLAIKRLSRCHPFSVGGYDPVKQVEKI